MNKMFTNYDKIKCIYCNNNKNAINEYPRIFTIIECCNSSQVFWTDENKLHIIRFFLPEGVIEVTKHNANIYANVGHSSKLIKHLAPNINVDLNNFKDIFEKYYGRYMAIQMLK